MQSIEDLLLKVRAGANTDLRVVKRRRSAEDAVLRHFYVYARQGQYRAPPALSIMDTFRDARHRGGGYPL